MPYKDTEKQKLKSLRRYYKNREKKLEYQREYDKKNKDKKRKQDQKRYKTKAYNLNQNVRRYCQKYYFHKLLNKYRKCQLNLEECKVDKKLEIHHKKYSKKIEDCLLVCQNCHKRIHRKFSTRNKGVLIS